MPATDETWRLFVAMPLPERAVSAAATAQAALQRAAPHANIRWTPPHQFHLTLRFLGDVPAARVPALQDNLQAACAGHAPLQLQLHGIGFFPGAQQPRVVWMGLQGQLDALHALQQAVADAVAGFAEDATSGESFSAHITLGRVKFLSPPERSLLVDAARHCGQAPPAAWKADRVQLMRSLLSAEGARHQCLAAWTLRPAEGTPT